MDEEKMNELLASSMQVIKETSELNKESALIVKQLSLATTEQTKIFIMQIDKLSKRLDASEEDRRSLLRIAEEKDRQIDRLISLLHDSIINHTNFIQQQ